VREGDWKLIGNAWDTTKGDKDKRRIPLFLANLAEDIDEKADQAPARPELVERLRKLHENWARPITK
jgi:hypothetical protein